MTDSELHPYVEWIVREARRPVAVDADARARLLDALHSEPAPDRHVSVWNRLRRPRVFDVSPMAALALAAGLVGIGVVTGLLVNGRDGHPLAGHPQDVAVAPQLPVSPTPTAVHDTVMVFALVAPNASKVSLVGDFNGWSVTATPLARGKNSAVWSVTVPLSVGRHLYSFVVDSAQWMPDPNAPLAPDDGFGHRNSVVLVNGGSAL
jgi:hypothetical protein